MMSATASNATANQGDVTKTGTVWTDVPRNGRALQYETTTRSDPELSAR
jgi:hypothetical protein